LPGKVLLPLANRVVLRWVLDRLARATRLDEIVVATSDAASDDLLADRCMQWGVGCFRGSEADVLGRFAAAATDAGADWIVRVNADNPLVDPHYADALVAAAVDRHVDYASFRRGDGRPVMLTALSFFLEIVSRDCLDRAAREITDPFLREHVTLGIYQCPQRFDVHWLDVPSCCNDPDLRFTLDTPDDLELLGEMFLALGDDALTVTAEDAVRLVAGRPDWRARMAALNRTNPKSADR
jgi:spore coat polysaccharide biosynthesis protein SpsF